MWHKFIITKLLQKNEIRINDTNTINIIIN